MLKKIISILFALPIMLAGCGEEEDKTSSERKLLMVTSADYPPFEFFKTSGGAPKIVGLDIDLVKRIGEYLGYNIEIRDMDYAGLIPAVQSGRADFAMAGITPTEERAQSVSFSQSYYQMNNTMVHRVDNDFLSRKDFEGTKIGVLLGSTHEQFAKIWAAENPGVTIVPLNRAGDAIQEVIAGRVDGVIMDETPAAAYVSRNSQQLTMENLEGHSFGSAILFAKDSPLVAEFNKALDHLRETGDLDEIIRKWVVGQ